MTTVRFNPVVTRRRFAAGAALGAAALALGPARLRFAAAQDAADLASLGLSELNVTVTDTGYEDAPEELPAGRYLLNLTSTTTKGPGTISFLSPTPVGMSVNDLAEALSGMAGPPPDATPAAGDQGGNGGGDEAIPLIFYQMYFAGGASAAPGATAQAVIDLKPGEYMVWPEDPSEQKQPAIMTVTGDYPADAPEPDAASTITLLDFAIAFDGEMKAGKHLIKLQNHGAQPHFLVIIPGPDTMTNEQIQTSLKTGEPVPGAAPEEETMPVFMSPAQSIGVTTWQHIELEAGTYAAACFFPTAGTGVPHAMVGMTEVFKVAG